MLRLAPEDFGLPGNLRIAVEDQQMTIRCTTAIHICPGLFQSFLHGVFQGFVLNFQFQHHALRLAVAIRPDNQQSGMAIFCQYRQNIATVVSLLIIVDSVTLMYHSRQFFALNFLRFLFVC